MYYNLINGLSPFESRVIIRETKETSNPYISITTNRNGLEVLNHKTGKRASLQDPFIQKLLSVGNGAHMDYVLSTCIPQVA